MDADYLESRYRLHEVFPRLQELLRRADGAAASGNGAAKVSARVQCSLSQLGIVSAS